VLRGRVIAHPVEDDAQVALMRLVEQPVECF
jgi:hypothetical protein